MLPRMVETGREAGIEFDYGGKVAATQRSHALIEAAYKHGGAFCQDAVVEALFKFYFESQGNLGDAAAVRKTVTDAGLPGDVADAVLSRPAREVHAEVEAAVDALRGKYGVSGVPFFVFNGAMSVSGAQDPSTLAKIFERLAPAS